MGEGLGREAAALILAITLDNPTFPRLRPSFLLVSNNAGRESLSARTNRIKSPVSRPQRNSPGEQGSRTPQNNADRAGFEFWPRSEHFADRAISCRVSS